MVRRGAARNISYLRNDALSELRLELRTVADCRDPAKIGLSLKDMLGVDPEVCRQIGAAARGLGHQGILVPSAALEGVNLIVLPENLPLDLPIEVVSTRPLLLDPPDQD
jgi:RES domain-containing protein